MPSDLNLAVHELEVIATTRPTFGYLSDLGERVGDPALTEIRRLQIAKTKQRDGSGPGARGRLGGPR
jgi:hypothetical protein